jgi:hypothetical protein
LLIRGVFIDFSGIDLDLVVEAVASEPVSGLQEP